jgi:L-fuconolactonase
MTIVDSHSHGWPKWPYDPAVPDPNSRGRLEQLLWEMDRVGVDQAVIVCAGLPGNRGNNDYVARFAAGHRKRLHVFADVDSLWTRTYHTDGAANRLSRLAMRLHLKGFTHYLRDVVDSWFDSRAGDEFLDAAESGGLILSLSASPAWQPVIRRIAKRHPSLSILCHHMGFVRREGSSWAGLKEVLASADTPNILLKVSGFHYAQAETPMQGMTLPETWAFPYSASVGLLRRLHAAFGARRLCWGSDYPVVARSMTYRQSLEVVRSQSDFLSVNDLNWILGRTMLGLLEKGSRAA